MDLHYISATELLNRYQDLSLSPIEVCDAYLRRINQLNDKVNAFTSLNPEVAMSNALQAKEDYHHGSFSALSGLQLAIKDETYIAGEPMTNGSLLLKDNIASTTDPAAEKLLTEKASVIGRTTTPEFSASSVTWSNLWGVSRNPWNLDVTCGGSSGGSAIAVASGMCSFANGTDIGGSIRIPAAMCGVYGYKPPHGRIAEISPYNIDPYCHHGVIARSVDDTFLAYQNMKGPHPLDSHSYIPDNFSISSALPDVRGMRIAVSTNLGFYQVEPDIIDNLLASVRLLKQAGATVEVVEIDWDERIIQTAKTHQRALMGKLMLQDYGAPEQRKVLTPYMRHYLDKVEQTTLDDVFQANQHLCEMWDKIAPVFARFDALLCPTVATSKVPADYDYSVDQLEINGRPVDASKGWFMTYPFNSLGQCPVMAMPNGMCTNQVPSSLQIVGRPYQEAPVFAIARYLEQAQPIRWYQDHFPSFQSVGLSGNN
ncbi:amidase [Thalassotalea mangrovi]|uniref:Amidase n=1 Tax=Thalassotalea mangrovi TaxID=2572245 RepID=A0A4U1B7Z3_9GAMM|nr:amidase [Thalassotalea mangrovi]TKB46372.1 amidase [Thalassotalea mangrovi]